MRFTLKTLLVAISVAAVLCCIFFTLPALVAIVMLSMIWMLAPPAIIAGIVYGRGYGRAFCIGCVATGGLFPVVWLYSLMMFVSVFSEMSDLSVDAETAIYVKLAFGATFVLIGLSGLISMAIRFLSLRMAVSASAAARSPSPAEYSVLQRVVTTLPANPSSPGQGSPEPTTED